MNADIRGLRSQVEPGQTSCAAVGEIFIANRFDWGAGPKLQALSKRGRLLFSTNGGVLVSTEGLRTGSHAEDDSLASLKIESKNQTPIKNWLSRLN